MRDPREAEAQQPAEAANTALGRAGSPAPQLGAWHRAARSAWTAKNADVVEKERVPRQGP